MKTLDELYEIYEAFLVSVDYNLIKTDLCLKLDDGKSKAFLELFNGFKVELVNDSKRENGASMCCWWNDDKENVVSITSLDQLKQEFNRKK